VHKTVPCSGYPFR